MPILNRMAKYLLPAIFYIFFEGNTSVMVGVYGPAEVRLNKEIVDKATVEVVFRPKTGIPGKCSRSK